MTTIGSDTEFLLYYNKDNNPIMLRAKDFMAREEDGRNGCWDGNCSICEIRTPVIKAYDYKAIVEGIYSELRRNANHIMSVAGLDGLSMEFHFKPYDAYVYKYAGVGDFPFDKTAGLHLHQAGVVIDDFHRSLVARHYQYLYDRFSENNKKRMVAPVIGPQSGKVYRYGAPKGYWKLKDGARHHWEFRAFPSSSVILDDSLVELAYRFCMPKMKQLSDEELQILIDGMNKEVVIPIVDLLEPHTNQLHIYKIVSRRKNGAIGYIDYSHTVEVKSKVPGNFVVILCKDEAEIRIVQQNPSNYEGISVGLLENKLEEALGFMRQGVLPKEFVPVDNQGRVLRISRHLVPPINDNDYDFMNSLLTNRESYKKVKQTYNKWQEGICEDKVIVAWALAPDKPEENKKVILKIDENKLKEKIDWVERARKIRMEEKIIADEVIRKLNLEIEEEDEDDDWDNEEEDDGYFGEEQ